jgi:iron complex outermembrane receptor protein
MQIGCRQILVGIILATAIILDAQDCPAAGSVQGAAAEAHTYSIPPGPLDVVLIQFATASKMDLAFDADALRKLHSAGLTGPHTIADGIGILLHETGYYAVDLRDGGT